MQLGLCGGDTLWVLGPLEGDSHIVQQLSSGPSPSAPAHTAVQLLSSGPSPSAPAHTAGSRPLDDPAGGAKRTRQADLAEEANEPLGSCHRAAGNYKHASSALDCTGDGTIRPDSSHAEGHAQDTLAEALFLRDQDPTTTRLLDLMIPNEL